MLGVEQGTVVDPEVASDTGVTSFEDGGRTHVSIAIVVFSGILLALFLSMIWCWGVAQFKHSVKS